MDLLNQLTIDLFSFYVFIFYSLKFVLVFVAYNFVTTFLFFVCTICPGESFHSHFIFYKVRFENLFSSILVFEAKTIKYLKSKKIGPTMKIIYRWLSKILRKKMYKEKLCHWCLLVSIAYSALLQRIRFMLYSDREHKNCTFMKTLCSKAGCSCSFKSTTYYHFAFNLSAMYYLNTNCWGLSRICLL